MPTATFTEPTRGSHAAALLLCRCGVEIWKTTFESDAHEVSNFGRVRRATTKHILKGHVNQVTGYRSHGIGGQTFASHRLVARAFIPNPDSKPTVDHIDASEKSNNKLTNLRWATSEEQWANSKRRATNEKKRRPVRMLVKETREFIRKFDSAIAAASSLGKPRANSEIGNVCQGKNKSALGYAWEYEPAKTIEGEEWRQIPRELFDLQEPHEVSSYGRLRNMTSMQVTTGSVASGGIFFSLVLTQTKRKVSVPNLIARVFIPNPCGKPEVLHRDGVSSNNHVSNLEWATRTEVIQAAWVHGMSNSWTKEEDAALLNMYETRGRPKRLRWTELPEILQGRTNNALSNRLCNLLKNAIGKPKQWTEEEDTALRNIFETLSRPTRVKWKSITLPKILQNRTVFALQHRLHRLNQSETSKFGRTNSKMKTPRTPPRWTLGIQAQPSETE